MNNPMQLALDFVLAFEAGDYKDDPAGYLEGFALLISTGVAWQLQGYYGRTCAEYIKAGYISEAGEVTELGREVAEGGE